jgi:hypothetical protein
MRDGAGPVRVAEAANEMDAAVMCGYLESRGIHAISDNGGSLGSAFPTGNHGPFEILVAPEHAEEAHAILAAADGAAGDRIGN